MASYILYFPAKQGANRQHLIDAGLGDLLADGDPMFGDQAGGGPDNGGGLLAWWDCPTDPSRNPRPLFDLPNQTWLKGVTADGTETDAYWLGWWNNAPVRPIDIARRKQYDGRELELGDGQTWLLPVARQLPHLLGLGGKRRIKPQYREFFEATMADVDRWLRVTTVPDGESSVSWSLNDADALVFAARALAMNYRVTAPICDLLGLVSTECVAAIVQAVAAGEWFERAAALDEAQKKTPLQVMPTTSAGVPG